MKRRFTGGIEPATKRVKLVNDKKEVKYIEASNFSKEDIPPGMMSAMTKLKLSSIIRLHVDIENGTVLPYVEGEDDYGNELIGRIDSYKLNFDEYGVSDKIDYFGRESKYPFPVMRSREMAAKVIKENGFKVVNSDDQERFMPMEFSCKLFFDFIRLQKKKRLFVLVGSLGSGMEIVGAHIAKYYKHENVQNVLIRLTTPARFIYSAIKKNNVNSSTISEFLSSIEAKRLPPQLVAFFTSEAAKSASLSDVVERIRDAMGEGVYVGRIISYIDRVVDDNIIIIDARTEAEILELESRGGVVIGVTKDKGITVGNYQFKHVIKNVGTSDDLVKATDAILKKIDSPSL